MESIVIEVEVNDTTAPEAVEELNLSELALVGGGSASMIFA
jgi:hypothetical protein